MQRLDALGDAEIEAAFADLEGAGAAEMEKEGVDESAIEFIRQLDLRYVGQSYELTIPSGSDAGTRFHAEHDRTYGFSAEAEPIECVSLRLSTVGRIAKPPLRALSASGVPAPKATRQVYFAESTGYVDCPIYDRYTLGADARFAGPAIVEEFDSTTVVHPGYGVRVDGQGNLIIEREGA
jgi:N-methylhydantoinase A